MYLLIFMIFTSLMNFENVETEINTLPRFNQYPPNLKTVVTALESLPEAQELISRAQIRGSIAISWLPSEKFLFGGLWHSRERIIYLNPAKTGQIGALIQTLLIELHNAADSDYLEYTWQQARQGLIDKETFIKNLERWEHRHVVDSAAIILLGIRHGFFPPEAYLPVHMDFEQHYHIQQQSGHSQWFASKYDQISPKH